MQVEIFCGFPLTRVRVTCTGDVAMCCFQHNACIGNLLNNTFDEIWFSEIAEEIRAETLEGRLHNHCRNQGCPFVTLSPPYSLQNVTYNEYPTFLEVESGRFTPGVLSKLVHLLPNLGQIHIQGGEPFSQNVLFDILDQFGFDQYRNQIIVSTVTNGEGLKPVCQEWLRRCPRSILTMCEAPLDSLQSYGENRDRKQQFLILHNRITISNTNHVAEMVQLGHKVRANRLEFDSEGVTEENCGIFKRAHLDIVEECEKLRVAYNFIRPLDLGLSDRLVQIAF